jgi:hypothetical protein
VEETTETIETDSNLIVAESAEEGILFSFFPHFAVPQVTEEESIAPETAETAEPVVAEVDEVAPEQHESVEPETEETEETGGAETTEIAPEQQEEGISRYDIAN